MQQPTNYNQPHDHTSDRSYDHSNYGERGRYSGRVAVVRSRSNGEFDSDEALARYLQSQEMVEDIRNMSIHGN